MKHTIITTIIILGTVTISILIWKALNTNEQYIPFAGKLPDHRPCVYKRGDPPTGTCFADDGPGGIIEDWGTEEEYKLKI